MPETTSHGKLFFGKNRSPLIANRGRGFGAHRE